METLTIVLAGAFGLLFGSFANVVIHRIPDGHSIVKPPSACPTCGHRIAARDNVPVLSWVLLRGRCRHCAEPISARYPLVELAMGVVFAVVAWRIGPDPALPAFLLFAWLLVVVAVIDARTQRIPNRLTYTLTPALVVLLVAAALLSGDPVVALRVLLGGLAAFAAMLALALIAPRGMGMGDVKLSAFIGAGLGYLGWGHVLLGMMAAYLLGGLTAIALIVLGIRGRKEKMPFGPYLAVGALVSLLVGTELVQAYLRSSGLA